MNKTKLLTSILGASALAATQASAATINYNFDDGTLQGWANNVPSGTASEDFLQTTDTNGGKTPAQSGTYKITESTFSDRDGDTLVKVLSSPGFIIDGSSTISFYLNGGMGSESTPGANYSDLPTAGGAGFLGVALRRVSDGAYVLSDRKDNNAQDDAGWELQGWNATELAAATTTTDIYQLDLIDTFKGGWGWTALDTVSMTNVTAVPEPSSVALLGLGGLALILRRRRA